MGVIYAEMAFFFFLPICYHGNIFPFYGVSVQKDLVSLSGPSVYYLLQWKIATRAELRILSSGEEGKGLKC